MSQAQYITQYKNSFLAHYNEVKTLDKLKLEKEGEAYVTTITRCAAVTEGLGREFNLEKTISKIKTATFSEEKPYQTSRIFFERKSMDEINYLTLIHELLNQGFVLDRSATAYRSGRSVTTSYITLLRPSIDETYNTEVAKRLADERIKNELENIKASYFKIENVKAFIAKCKREEAQAIEAELEAELDNMFNNELNEEINEFLEINKVLTMSELREKFTDTDSEYLKTMLTSNGFKEARKDYNGTKQARVWAKQA